jgi:hypothetical protein
VGNVAGFPPESESEGIPGRNCITGQAVRRLCTSPLRLDLTADPNSSRTFATDSDAIRISPSHRVRCRCPCLRFSAGRLIPNRDLSQPHKVGDTNNCARQRRRLRHPCVSAWRPNLALIERAVSPRIKCRYNPSMMTVAAYHRHGCSQSGNRLIVWPQSRHRYRRTQITIHPTRKPRT